MPDDRISSLMEKQQKNSDSKKVEGKRRDQSAIESRLTDLRGKRAQSNPRDSIGDALESKQCMHSNHHQEEPDSPGERSSGESPDTDETGENRSEDYAREE